MCASSDRLVIQVCLDTASFEVVQNCWQTLLSVLKEGLVDLLLCNEAEALAVAQVNFPIMSASCSIHSGCKDHMQYLDCVQGSHALDVLCASFTCITCICTCSNGCKDHMHYSSWVQG